MALPTQVSQPDLSPGAWVLIHRQSICPGDQLAMSFPDNSQGEARVVGRQGASLIIEAAGRKIELRPWTKADPPVPDFRGEGSRWVIAS
ncbi:MAG: hypothetical protein JWM33_1777 [Caulobacteraceae bacterium]|nr:hypothetical protein [Caulobacteraceae bacterium]